MSEPNVCNLISLKKITILLILVYALQGCKNNSVREIPVYEFFKTPEKSYFKISPDGDYISYLKTYKGKQNLFIQSLIDHKERQVTAFNDFSVREYSWTYNDKIIFRQDINDHHQSRMYALDPDSMKMHLLFTQDKARIRMLLTKNQLQPDVITIAMNNRDSANFDVYRLNIRSRELKPYITNPGNIVDWFTDLDGKIRLAKASDGVDKKILYRPDEKTPFKAIIKNNFKNSVDPIAFTGYKNYFYALSNVGRDKSALVEINAENGREEKVIFASDKADITEVSYIRNKHKLESVTWEEAKQRIHFLDTNIKKVYQDLYKRLHGCKIRITDRDSAETKYIINTSDDRDPGSYYVYELKSKKLINIGDNNPLLKPDELCAMRPVAFKASDGLLINGYLTLPQGGETNLPVVVMPHSGPWRRDSWGYSSEVQFLANRGYAVFQINYRGSTGYGKAFYNAGFKQVGGKIQQDITDGVKWLIAKKIANPKKIAIMGGGFGGFSALYGISFHPELYTCAVVQYGLINFFTYIKDVPPYFKASLQMMYEMVGNPETDADQLRAISPVFHADKIKLPLLIFQGGRDPRANISELNQFVSELKRHKVPVTYVLKENERTSFKSEHTRMQMYADIEKFLDNNMRVKQ